MPNIRHIVRVDLDSDVIEVARTVLWEDNRGSLDNPRVEKITMDTFTWLHEQVRGKSQVQKLDTTHADLPDPDNVVLTKLYSQESYGLIRTAAAPGTKLVVQPGSSLSTPQAFWRTDSSARAVGWPTTPYHMHTPTFGDWGFVFAQAGPEPLTLEFYDGAPPLKLLTPGVARVATVFGADNSSQ